ncbi:dihydrodipicolinate synthase family protein [Sinirhodobacter huangdaonensis]|uniref:Dihydrodipicolinate synthase family protein n=1 Tax=Paenirhodobacter huangdaonensis TaxID=2501515 RepID=A0A3S3MT44_9RHOB|nr:dihydrodipicolinate synthase family protein [Sinirhodobacter huangdaonensis]RWR54713.1 dihydrodipicolinate synthase family protein [Sinirhodobacter huangdaonensis]
MALIDQNSSGVFVISVTPFDEGGAIDWDSLDRVVDFYFEKGATGLTVLGMMGEAPKMTQTESVAIVKRVLARAGGRPIVVGVSAPGLAAIGELTAQVMDLGAAGVMVAPPGSLNTDPAIHRYYGQVVTQIGDAVPVVLQDFPLSTKVQISDEILQRIIVDYPSIKMVKHEDWPGLNKISRIRAAEAAGQRRVSILCGNGGLFLPEEMARGADGAMTGFGFPEMLVNVVRLMTAGEEAKAQDLFDAHLPLIRYETQPGLGLAVRKHMLARRGAIASPALRAPGAGLDARAVTEVDRLMARLQTRLKELN